MCRDANLRPLISRRGKLIGRRGSNWFFVVVSAPPLSNPSYAPALVYVYVPMSVRVWIRQAYDTRVDQFYYDFISSFRLEWREYVKNMVFYANCAI